MDTDTIEFCCPLTVNGMCIAEIEGHARIVSPFTTGWEISIYEAGTYRLISLDGIKPTDKDADLKAGLRTLIEDHVWKMQDAVHDALATHRKGERERQRADSVGSAAE
jgi:hypothetical protein